jgi:hypothetical protein|tara:strand:- start:749 stop:958 length:210 start_codon:yes stop_codon:yes gene_type:complete
MTSYIQANRRSWFSIDQKVKKMNNSPTETKRESLLKRPESDMSEDIDKTTRYVKVIRDAFKKNMDIGEQ